MDRALLYRESLDRVSWNRGHYGFGDINCKNLKWKASFFVQWQVLLNNAG